MTAFFVLVMSGYFTLLILLLWGWSRNGRKLPTEAVETVFISVIIPFRNEQDRIGALLLTLREIDYPPDRFEIIFVNDDSQDQSVQKIEALTHDCQNYKIIDSADVGKKQALTTGVDKANGEIIVTTDADCQVQPNWLKVVNKQFQDKKLQLVFGGVKINEGTGFFSRLQQVELVSLIGSSAATLQLGFFSMCNGANMAYRKMAFKSVNGYQGNESIPSGDDEFLARKIDKAFPGGIQFLAYSEAVVSTGPVAAVREFLWQRRRWAGKWKFNQSMRVKLLAVWILIFQLSFAVLVVCSLLRLIDIQLGAVLISIKVILEAVFLLSVSKFLRSGWSWSAFIAWQFIYPLYVFGVGISSLGGGYEWKGRRLTNKM